MDLLSYRRSDVNKPIPQTNLAIPILTVLAETPKTVHLVPQPLKVDMFATNSWIACDGTRRPFLLVLHFISPHTFFPIAER